jgi:uncharacterized surface protein with fasciclin (FAS1) repeats
MRKVHVHVAMVVCLALAAAAGADEPQAPGNVVAVAAASDSFKTFTKAVKAAGLTEKLQSEGPFTVFAPTDAAFAKLPKEQLEDLLKPENKEQLQSILACHVVPAKTAAAEIKTGKVTAVNGRELSLKAEKGTVTVDGAKVVQADIAASNGVIHAIDTVLLPATASAKDKPKDHPAH